MRVIITGGTGLIGSRLAASLADDYEVIALSRNPDKRQFPAGVRGQRWDAETAKDWGDLADGAYAIVNLAGESIAGKGLLPSRWTPERKRRIRQSRTKAGRAVVEAIEAAAEKPKVLVQASAVGYYGPSGNEKLTVDAPPGDDFLAEVCVMWESVTEPVEEMGVRRVTLRTGVVLSEEGGALPLMALPYKFFVGGPLGDGNQWMPWIHLEDEARAIRFLMEHEEADGPFNLAAPNPVRNREFGQRIGEVLGRPSFFPTPAFALRLALGEMSTIVLDGQRAVPERLQELGFDFNYVEVTAALDDLLS